MGLLAKEELRHLAPGLGLSLAVVRALAPPDGSALSGGCEGKETKDIFVNCQRRSERKNKQKHPVTRKSKRTSIADAPAAAPRGMPTAVLYLGSPIGTFQIVDSHHTANSSHTKIYNQWS